MTDLTLLRPIEVHKKWGIPRDRLYRAIHDGELVALNFGCNKKPSYLIQIVDLQAWLESLKVQPRTGQQ